MKKILLLLLGFVAAVVVGLGIYRQRGQNVEAQLVRARSALGSRAGGVLLEDLARRAPKNSEVQFLHARQFRLEGHSQQAAVCLDRAAALGWPQPQIDRERLLLLAQVDFRLAESELQKQLDDNPSDRDVLLALASGNSAANRLDKAALLVQRLLQQDPRDGATLYERGKIALQSRRLDQARPDLEGALQFGPDQVYVPSARFLLANCLLDLGQFEPALQLYRQCRAEDPDNPRVLFGIGQCNRFLNHPEDAEEAFQAVLHVRPNHVDSLLQLAHLNEQRGDFRQSLAYLESAEKQRPDLYAVHFQLSKILRALRENERAAAHEKRYQDIEKGWLSHSTHPSSGEFLDSRDNPSSTRNPD